jgi:hypothetical protein
VNSESDDQGSGIAGNSARKRSKRKFKSLTYAKSWEKGAIGEENVGKAISNLCTEYRFKFLHDRKIPGTRANIDHILITDRGIFVVDTKNYKGAVRIKESGGLFWPFKETLLVGNRNQTKLVLGVKKQVELVLEKTLQIGYELPVFGVLAFYKADFPILFKPKKIDGVLINSKGIQALILNHPIISATEIHDTYLYLEKAFPAY